MADPVPSAKTVTCPSCGEKNTQFDNECRRCRASLGIVRAKEAPTTETVTCPSCGETNTQFDNECRRCSAYLGTWRSPGGASETLTEADVRGFIGYLSAAVPELHKVEVPLLAKHWSDYKWTTGRRAPEPGAEQSLLYRMAAAVASDEGPDDAAKQEARRWMADNFWRAERVSTTKGGES